MSYLRAPDRNNQGSACVEEKEAMMGESSTLRDVEKALMAEAERITANMQNRIRELEAEFADVERREIYLEAELQAAHASRERLEKFAARIGRNYQCPSCWVRDGTNYAIRAVPSPTEDDLLRCDRCGRDWVV